MWVDLSFKIHGHSPASSLTLLFYSLLLNILPLSIFHPVSQTRSQSKGKGKGKGKVCPRTSHEGSEGE